MTHQTGAGLTKPARTGVAANARSADRSSAPITDAFGQLVRLQAVAGNQGTERLMRARLLQARLTVSQAEDVFEQEADRVADAVIRTPDPAVGADRTPSPRAQRSCTDCQEQLKRQPLEEEEPLQRKPMTFESALQRQALQGEEDVLQAKLQSTGSPEVAPEVESAIDALPGRGQPLPASLRSFMEPRFGYDFSEVRVHTDQNAGDISRALSARAFAVGGDVVFGAGQYAPETADGQRLIAHELTHVLQQGGATGQARALVARFPSPPDCDTFRPGLAYVKPIIKEGYDGTAYTAIKTGWEPNSFTRRWQIYDAEDTLLHEESYTWPSPTLYIPKDVVAKGKAGGATTPWSVWIKVTRTMVPFGGSDPSNFPHSYMKFYVYETWDDYMADPKARLSEAAGKPGEAKPSPLEPTGVSGARSVLDYGSVVSMHEAYLREIYDQGAKGITQTAQTLVENGAPQGDVAEWAVEARNQLKATIRDRGNAILKKVFESRNLAKYGNELGPSYQQLYNELAKKGLTPEEINSKIIQGSGKANLKVNRWAGRLKIAGRILLALDIALAGVRVALAPEGERVKTALKEVARIAGALAVGAVGAKGGAAAGAAIGALFGGAGAIPGAIIGGIIGGIGGAFLGGWLGESLVEKIYEMFPPSDCVFEGDYTEEER